MERLTVKWTDKVYDTLDPVDILDNEYSKTNYNKLLTKLGEYEDFEEIFRAKMTDTACEFLKDKEEFGKWLDRNKWIAKKCDEYARAEEQGLLLRLPCKVGDTVYCIYERYTKCSESNQEFDEYSCQGCECLECDSRKEHYVQSQKAYSIDWIVSNLNRFGKTVFLTQEEAEQKLKEMESD